MGIVRKKKGISNKNKNNLQYGGNKLKSNISSYKPTFSTNPKTTTPIKTFNETTNKRSFFKKFGKRTYNTPKHIYSTLGALKNVAVVATKRGLQRAYRKITLKNNILDHISSQLQKKKNSFNDSYATKLIEIGHKNPYELGQEILKAKQDLYDQKKLLTNKKLSSNDVQKAQIEIAKHSETILKLEEEKAKLSNLASKTNDTKFRNSLLEALGKIDKYNTKSTKEREFSYFKGGPDAKSVFTKSRTDTFQGLKKNTFKTIGATFVPTILRRGITSITQGTRLKSLGLKYDATKTRLRSAKSMKKLSSRLAVDTKGLKKIGRDTKIVLTNIKNMQADIDSLKDSSGKPLTDSLSNARRDILTQKMFHQTKLLNALELKGQNYKKLIEQTQHYLELKKKRKQDKQIQFIVKSKENAAQLLGSIDVISKTIDSKNPNPDKFIAVQTLLKTFEDTKDNELKNLNFTNKEIDDANANLKEMYNGLVEKQKKIKDTSSEEYKNIESYKQYILNQEEPLRKLYEKKSAIQNTEILLNQSKQITKFFNNTKIKASDIVNKKNNNIALNLLTSRKDILGFGARLARNSLKSIPGLSSNKASSQRINKYAINIALNKLDKIPELKLVPPEYKKMFKKDRVLLSFFEADGTKFKQIFDEAKKKKFETEDKKIKYIKEKYAENKTIDTKEVNVKIKETTEQIAKRKTDLDIKINNLDEIRREKTTLYDSSVKAIDDKITKIETEINTSNEKKIELEKNIAEKTQTKLKYDKDIELTKKSIEEIENKLLKVKIEGKDTDKIDELLLKANKNLDFYTLNKTVIDTEINTKTGELATINTQLKTFNDNLKIEKENYETNPEIIKYKKQKELLLNKEKEAKIALEYTKNIQLKLDKLQELLLEHARRELAKKKL